ncbi:MAG TPA: glycine cleavage system aminomethyltransferase GcvT [Fimbriimonadaceae bacterium]|jgi:aminomethyltransferase
MSEEPLLRTPLYESHIALGGKVVPFAGYEMPVQYKGIISESKAVRESAGMFDVSHMARLWFRGPKAEELLEWITSNDVSKLGDDRGQYSLLPNDTGGVVDDIIVYRVSEGVYRMVVNASNHEKDVHWMMSHNTMAVDIADDTRETAMIAVQGPKAVEILESLAEEKGVLPNQPAFGVVYGKIAGVDCFAARSGYTGEDGYEIICDARFAMSLWTALLNCDVTPCGLGSRDTLRVEAGLPLYGHELTDDTNPIAAGLGWVVSKTKSFIGCEPMQEARANGTPQKLQGVKLGSKRLPMPGMAVSVDGRKVGELTSGVYSPMLECGIGFAYIDSAIKLDTAAELDLRGKPEPATIVSKRFYKREK